MESLPRVSVILPVLNEVESIDLVVADLLGQDYSGPIDVIVADGGSVDGTREKLAAACERDQRLKVIENPDVGQAYGLNLAALEAAGDILVRADGHTSFAPDYVRRSVDVLVDTGGAVGGRMSPIGRSVFGRAVAAAMQNPLSMGPGRFHHAKGREEVDTVYLGAFRREDFDALGGFRPFPSGTSEDADFYYRWRESGRKVYVDPTIVSTYTPRDTPGALWRQYFRYGLGKAEMLWMNGRLPSSRPLAPFALVVGLMGAILIGLFARAWWPSIVLVAVWVALLIWVGIKSSESAARVILAAGVMHLAYGLGTLWGLIRGRGPIRRIESSPNIGL